ncbi:hypothetical protein Glove_103g111 [Diversispora epigaea]|uniref:Uncharacterized protein n=1 Tax=Diversispora epigaea TaxID=1348612 RepID=A0A397J637_9GLOM|nr:hypothetical protein Glove_103g111 [Diversispora epigaea]
MSLPQARISEQEDRPRRKVANYSSTRSSTTSRNRFKFNPLDKKNNNKNSGKNTTEKSSVSQGETQSKSSNTVRNNIQLKETTWEAENISTDKQNIMNLEEDNFNNDSNTDTGPRKVVDNDTTSKNQETTVVEDNESIISFEDINENQHEWQWQQVTNRKGKQKVVDNDTTSKNQETTVVEDNESIISFEDINENQHEWREAFGAKKYKIWTFASRIPGKTIGDKIEKIKKSFREVTELITVNSEVFNRQKMISVFFDNEEKMNTAKKINVSVDAAQSIYMHRAVIFKRNPQRDIMHGIKLWDIPIGMKYKELAFEISSIFGDIERMNLRTNDMWQSAIIVFKKKNSAEKIGVLLLVMTHSELRHLVSLQKCSSHVIPATQIQNSNAKIPNPKL